MAHDRGRRRFLTTTGGGVVAVAVLGIAACGSEEGTATTGGATTSTTAAGSTSPATTVTAEGSSTAPSTTSPPATSGEDEARTAFDWEQVSLGFVSAYVLSRAGRAVMVDTGTAGSVGDIEAGLDRIGLGWDAVDHVILTHQHPDHVGSLPDVLEQTPSAMAYAGDADIGAIAAPRDLTPVSDGDEVYGLAIVATPGHTPGHVAVFDPEGLILVAGDALTGGDAMGGEPGTLRGANPDFTPDLVAADDSVRKLANLGPDVVLVGHGTPVTGGAAPVLNDLAAGL